MNWRYHFRCRQRRNIFEGHACRQRSKLRSKIIMTTFSPASSPVVHLVCGSACTACVLNYSYLIQHLFHTHIPRKLSFLSVTPIRNRPASSAFRGERCSVWKQNTGLSQTRLLALLALLSSTHNTAVMPVCYIECDSIDLIDYF